MQRKVSCLTLSVIFVELESTPLRVMVVSSGRSGGCTVAKNRMLLHIPYYVSTLLPHSQHTGTSLPAQNVPVTP